MALSRISSNAFVDTTGHLTQILWGRLVFRMNGSPAGSLAASGSDQSALLPLCPSLRMDMSSH